MDFEVKEVEKYWLIGQNIAICGVRLEKFTIFVSRCARVRHGHNTQNHSAKELNTFRDGMLQAPPSM